MIFVLDLIKDNKKICLPNHTKSSTNAKPARCRLKMSRMLAHAIRHIVIIAANVPRDASAVARSG